MWMRPGSTKRLFASAALLLCALLAAPVILRAAAEDSAAALSAMETQLIADPDNLTLGAKYRQEIIHSNQYDRAIAFLEKLVADHPAAANAHLNYGFAYVDKIPAAGSITQVILANNALSEFTKSLELKQTWISLYTRGNSYLYWPAIFGRAPLGVADLEAAMKLQKASVKKSFHVRTYIALGDGYWKTDNLEKARQIWAEGIKEFPGNAALSVRVSAQGDALKTIIDDTYDSTKRVDTSLEELRPDAGTPAEK